MPLIFVRNETKKHETLSGIYHLSAAPWWLAGGISPAQVAAVYQPRWARNEADSMLDLSGNGRNLLKIGSPTWSAQNGWNIPAGGNHGYNNENVNFVSAIVRWSGRTLNQGAPLISKSLQKMLAAGCRFHTGSQLYTYHNKAVAGESGQNQPLLASHNAESGVYAANFNNGALWINGAQVSTAGGTPTNIYFNPKLIGQFDSYGNWQTSVVNILAVAFYTIELSAEQHAALYQSIMNI